MSSSEPGTPQPWEETAGADQTTVPADHDDAPPGPQPEPDQPDEAR